jgi:hypothetical protein
MLKMGGSEILKSLAHKSNNIKADNAQFVYQWVDPERPLLERPSDFLLSRTKENFEELYS